MHDESSDAERQMRQQERWDRAITISILAVIASGILGSAALERFRFRGCRYPKSAVCINSLKALDGAKATWALENHADVSAVPTDADLFGPDKYFREKPVCPAGGTYAVRRVGQRPHCSIPGHTL